MTEKEDELFQTTIMKGHFNDQKMEILKNKDKKTV